MSHKRANLIECSFCGSDAHMQDVDWQSRGRTVFSVVCNNKSCRLSVPPIGMYCKPTEEEAAAEWNGGLR